MRHPLLRALESCDLDVRAYSGRGMSTECLGCVASAGALLEAVALYCADAPGDAEEIARTLRDTCEDNMGRRTIYYWPSVAHEEDA